MAATDDSTFDARVLQRARPNEKFASKRYHGIDITIVNALRRIVLAEIPYVATYRDDDRCGSMAGGFVVRANTGRLHDDMLVDRIALVPIHLTRDEVLNFIPGSITVDLKVANETKVVRDVTSEDLDVKLFGKPHPKGKMCHPACFVSGEHALITRLYPGERIHVSSTLEKATPVTHAAFAVASNASIKLGLDERAYEEELRSLRAEHACSSERERARAINRLEHIGRERLVRRTPDGDPETATLCVESESGLSGTEIIRFAEDELVKKFTTDNISFDVRTEPDGVSFTIHKQGHTFGSVLQALCMRDRAELAIKSVGYYVPHPLETDIVVRVALLDSASKPNANDGGGGEKDSGGDLCELFSRMRAHCARKISDSFSGGEAGRSA